MEPDPRHSGRQQGRLPVAIFPLGAGLLAWALAIYLLSGLLPGPLSGLLPGPLSGPLVPSEWRTSLDRAEVLKKARAVASLAGYQTHDWQVLVTTRILRGDIIALRAAGPASSSLFLSPFIYVVQLSTPASPDRIQIELTSRGDLRRFEIRNRQFRPPGMEVGETTPGLSQEAMAPEAMAQEEIRPPTVDGYLPETVFQHLILLLPQLQFNRSSFTLSDSGAAETLREWTLPLEEIRSPFGVLLHPAIKVGTRHGKLTRVEFLPGLTPELRGLIDGGPSWTGRMASLVSGLEIVYVWPLLLVVLVWFFLGIIYRRMQWRRTIHFWWLILVFLTLSSVGSSSFDGLRMDITFSGAGNLSGASGLVAVYGPLVAVTIVYLIFSFMAFVVYATGLSISVRLPRRKTLGIELLLRGRLLVRPLTTGLVYGIALGGILTVIPLLVWRSGIFPAAVLKFSSFHYILAGRYPGAATLSLRAQFIFFIIFAVVAPLIELRYGKEWVGRGLTWLLVLLASAGSPSAGSPSAGSLGIEGSFGAMAVTAVLVSMCLTVIYAEFQLLGVMTALISSGMGSAALFLMNQSSTTLRQSGGNSLWCLGSLLVIGLVLHWRARPAPVSDVEIPPNLLVTQIERERLKAHFEVARRAQQSLLPMAPPAVDSYDIAASCLPSREVGGDLYDFIKFSDDQVGIVVADVSGKGVPAALFMTLTKGLLSSLTERLRDPGEILRAMNQHLYQVSRRRIFVTMFLAIVDPRSGRMIYARAGHNPSIHFESTTGLTHQLNARGIGLGLGNNKIFVPTLGVRTVELAVGDVVVFYSDGITEAMNRQKNEYGMERLAKVVAEHATSAAAVIRDRILLDVVDFLGEEAAQDDQTLVVLKRVGGRVGGRVRGQLDR